MGNGKSEHNEVWWTWSEEWYTSTINIRGRMKWGWPLIFGFGYKYVVQYKIHDTERFS